MCISQEIRDLRPGGTFSNYVGGVIFPIFIEIGLMCNLKNVSGDISPMSPYVPSGLQFKSGAGGANN